MAKKSYDVSSNFSSNMKGKIKDNYDFSPAQSEHYNYKECIIKDIHLNGVQEQTRSAYKPKEERSMRKMKHMEQDGEMEA
jgi:hypothetical protein